MLYPPEDIGGSYVAYPQFLREVFSFQQDLKVAVLGDFKNFAKDLWGWFYTVIDEYKLDYLELMWSYARFEEDAFHKKNGNEKVKKLYQKKGMILKGCQVWFKRFVRRIISFYNCINKT